MYLKNLKTTVFIWKIDLNMNLQTSRPTKNIK